MTIALLSYKRRIDESGIETEETWLEDDEDEDEREQIFLTRWYDWLRDYLPLIKKRPKKIKERQIVLIVREHSTLDEKSAVELYEQIVEAIESYSEVLEGLKKWDGDGHDDNGHEGDRLGKQYKRMVWTHESPNGGRKLIRPIVDDAVRNWKVKS